MLARDNHVVGVTSITLCLNSTKTGAGRLEESVSPRRLTVFDMGLDLVSWSVENHLGLDRNVCHSPQVPLAHRERTKTRNGLGNGSSKLKK